MKIQVNIFITFTKAFALLVLILGCIFSIVYNSSEVIIFTLSLSSGLAGLKNWQDALTDRKHMDRNENPRNRNDNDYLDNDYHNQQSTKNNNDIG